MQWPGSRRRWIVFFRAGFVLWRMGVLLVLAIASAGGMRDVADGCAYCLAIADVEAGRVLRQQCGRLLTAARFDS